MGKQGGRCLICGSVETVKSHIFPRAILLDIRAQEKSLVQGDRGRPGIRFSQNGDWDDTMLCKEHEDQIGAADDYAVRFLRKGIEGARRVESGRALEVQNPRPSKLMHFAYASVWRTVNCRNGRSHNLNLGLYEQVLREALLKNGPYNLQLLIAFSHIGLEGRGRIPLVINPYKIRFMGLNCWQFVIGLFAFYLFVDRRHLPTEWSPYLANNNPLILSEGNVRDIRDIPGLRPVLEGMRQTKRQRRFP